VATVAVSRWRRYAMSDWSTKTNTEVTTSPSPCTHSHTTTENLFV